MFYNRQLNNASIQVKTKQYEIMKTIKQALLFMFLVLTLTIAVCELYDKIN